MLITHCLCVPSQLLMDLAVRPLISSRIPSFSASSPPLLTCSSMASLVASQSVACILSLSICCSVRMLSFWATASCTTLREQPGFRPGRPRPTPAQQKHSMGMIDGLRMRTINCGRLIENDWWTEDEWWIEADCWIEMLLWGWFENDWRLEDW